MDNQQAYDVWAESYDTGRNKTRDIEANALRESLSDCPASELDILEIGCGTGKNTGWLLSKAKNLVGVDFSAKMLARAKEKIADEHVEFRKCDLREEWTFSEKQFDLVTCSLALEHIEDINFVFGQARRVLRAGGLFYIGELHPFKQYQGSKARFETAPGVFELECFVHHVSEFFRAAKENNFESVDLKEWFDDKSEEEVGDGKQIPRLLTMIFKARESALFIR